MPNTGWSGFFPKVALGAFGILFAALLGYFIWLGTTIIEVRERTVGIEARLGSIEAEIKAFDEGRTREAEAKIEKNSERIAKLDEENGK